MIVVKSKVVGVVICDALSCGRGYLWVEKVAVELDRKEFTGATPNAADSRKYSRLWTASVDFAIRTSLHASTLGPLIWARNFARVRV